MFSPQTRQYFDQAQGFGVLDQANYEAEAGARSQGHFFRLQLQVDAQGVIQALAYNCPRCVSAIACGSYLHQALVGQTADAALQVTTQQVLEALGGLPVQRSFYAWLAVQAVQNALKGGHPSCS